jgi:hypothetical protein
MVHWIPQLHQPLIKGLDQKSQMNYFVNKSDFKHRFHLFTIDDNVE